MADPSERGTPGAWEARVDELERRVRQLEDALALRTRRAETPAAPYRDPLPAPPPIPAAMRAGAEETMETRVGLRWFNRLGALTVLLGLLLGASWASSHGYLGPELRLALAGLAAIVVFHLGARALAAPELGRRTVGLGVTTVGAFGLYLVPWAAAHLDRVMDPVLAGAFGIVVTATLATLAWRTGHRVHAFLAAAGGLSVPLLAHHGDGGFGGMWAWLTLLVLGALVAARAGGRGRVFAGVGIVLAPAAASYFVAGLLLEEVDRASLVLRAFACVATLLGFVAAHAQALRARHPGSRLDGAASALALVGAALVVGFAGAVTQSPGPSAAGLAGLAVLEVSLALGLRTHDEDGRVTGTWFALGLALALAAPIVGGADRHLLALWGSGIAAGAAFLAVRGGWRSGRALVLLVLVAALGMILSGLHDVATLSAREAEEWLGLLAALLAVLVAERGRSAIARVAGFAAHAVALVLLLRAGTRLDAGGFRLWSTLVPLGYGLAALAIGVARSDGPLRAVGLTLLCGVVAKVFLLDVWVASEGVRIAAFLALGGGLLAASFLYSRLADRADTDGQRSG